MPRLVRSKPLSERFLAWINPFDFFLWLSEEIQTNEWDHQTVGTQIGILFNFTFLLARANLRPGSEADDVFGDGSETGWLLFFARVWSLLLFGFCAINVFFTLFRTRAYRPFEASIDDGPKTTSAHRARVDSTPVSSPLKFIQERFASETAEARAHPDKTRDVWEIAAWDPLPLSQQIFCFFNPGHVYVYLMTLPLEPLNPRPSVAIFNCLMVQVILSSLLLLIQSRYKQLIRDNAIIQKEVFREYDTKFVHPKLHPVVRDAATQFTGPEYGQPTDQVELGTPATLIRRSFATRPNPNYSKHYDPENIGIDRSSPFVAPSAPIQTPITKPKPQYADSYTTASEIRRSTSRQNFRPSPAPSLAYETPINQPPTAYASPAGVPTAYATPQLPVPRTSKTAFGGNMGFYSHAESPLKKSTTLNDLSANGTFSPRNSREMAAVEQRDAVEKWQTRSNQSNRSSPTKSVRRHLSLTPQAAAKADRASPRPQSPRPPSSLANPKSRYNSFERYPSIR